MSEELIFASEEEAIQHLADLVKKTIKIAAKETEDLVEEWIVSKGVDMLPGEIKDAELDLKGEDILIEVRTTQGDEFTIVAPIEKVENQ